MKPAIAIHKLSKVYPPPNKKGKAFNAVTGVAFNVQEGEVVGLLGPNGAGKSTTISMLLGILSPTSGSIHYFGKDFFTHRSEILNQVTFASTYIRMPWRLSVMENLRIYGYMYGLSKAMFEKRAEKFLNYFGVWDQRHKTMNLLSAGQVTRIMLAKAFIPHPHIVLLDEPTASLDPDIAHEIRGFVKQQQKEFNTTILYTSHNMDEVTDVCDRVIFLKQGQIVAQDTPENLIKTLKDVTVELLVSDNLEQLVGLLKHHDWPCSVRDREVQITLPETQVAPLLQTLATANISYSQITVHKPSLEDYFLQLASK